jgi:hypothetical protein
MASWELVPCLGQLRTELNRIAPNRDKTTDGTIGNAAHQLRVSDHNDDEVGRVPIRDADSKHEVHAIDLDTDLREPGLTMEMVVQHVVGRCRSGAEKRLRYVIYRRRIWEASNGWKQRAYTGDSPHDEHAHFSASYETKHEASTASWGLEEIPVALTDADKKWLAAQITASEARTAQLVAAAETRLRSEINNVPAELLTTKTGDPSNPAREVRNHLIDLSQARDYEVDADNAKPDAIPAGSPLALVTAAALKILGKG